MKQAVADAFEHDPHVARSNHEQRIERLEQQTASTANKGHGRIEQRTLTSTTALNEYLDWPGVQQVFRLERCRTIKGKRKASPREPVRKANETRRRARGRKQE